MEKESGVKLVIMFIWDSRFYIKRGDVRSNISSICFNINVSDMDQIIDVKVILNSSGFEIVQGFEKCSDIQIENNMDNIALRRIKCFYLLPAVLLSVIIIGFLIGISIFFVVKAKIQLFLIVLALIIVLSTLFVYLIKKSINK